jgi:hypothetical protein
VEEIYKYFTATGAQPLSEEPRALKKQIEDRQRD